MVKRHQVRRGRRSASISNALLIALKIAAGAITGSIAILTEAAHSAIDLVASVIALVSVRKADEPPDREHPYGHEKVENLAAAIEGMLILVGAGIIIYEATRRLVVGAEVEHLGVGIAVIGFSAVANLGVSAYLGRRARALRLAGARGRRRPPAHRRAHLDRRARRPRPRRRSPASDVFDPIAALAVAVAIVVAGIRILHALVASAGGRGAAARGARSGRGRDRRAPGPPEMVGYHKLRARRAGARRYIDLHVQFRDGTTLEDAHELAHRLRDAIEAEIPDSDVLIHVEPEGALHDPETRETQPYRAG